MTTTVLERVTAWLMAEGVAFRAVQHAPTRTSEESARARGEPLHIGGKALLVKCDDAFRLFVLSAALRFDSAAARALVAARKTRFATPEELLERTGLTPGSVPPFGRPILPFDLFVDESIVANERIAFNAGSLTDSIVMATGDYLRVARPQCGRFALSSE